MKKLISLLMAIIISFMFTLPTMATEKANCIYSEDVFIKDEVSIDIPIKILNNSGIMGFSINIDYDENILSPKSVSKGEILSGMFDNSIGVSKNGVFKVVFSGTEDCKKDGILFTIHFDVIELDIATTSINLSYSSEDTFNENWQNVSLNCNPIKITISDSESDPGTEPSEPVVDDELLSVRIMKWLNSLPSILKYLLWIFVRPVALLISLFE